MLMVKTELLFIEYQVSGQERVSKRLRRPIQKLYPIEMMVVRLTELEHERNIVLKKKTLNLTLNLIATP